MTYPQCEGSVTIIQGTRAIVGAPAVPATVKVVVLLEAALKISWSGATATVPMLVITLT